MNQVKILRPYSPRIPMTFILYQWTRVPQHLHQQTKCYKAECRSASVSPTVPIDIPVLLSLATILPLEPNDFEPGCYLFRSCLMSPPDHVMSLSAGPPQFPQLSLLIITSVRSGSGCRARSTTGAKQPGGCSIGEVNAAPTAYCLMPG